MFWLCCHCFSCAAIFSVLFLMSQILQAAPGIDSCIIITNKQVICTVYWLTAANSSISVVCALTYSCSMSTLREWRLIAIALQTTQYYGIVCSSRTRDSSVHSLFVCSWMAIKMNSCNTLLNLIHHSAINSWSTLWSTITIQLVSYSFYQKEIVPADCKPQRHQLCPMSHCRLSPSAHQHNIPHDPHPWRDHQLNELHHHCN